MEQRSDQQRNRLARIYAGIVTALVAVIYIVIRTQTVQSDTRQPLITPSQSNYLEQAFENPDLDFSKVKDTLSDQELILDENIES